MCRRLTGPAANRLFHDRGWVSALFTATQIYGNPATIIGGTSRDTPGGAGIAYVAAARANFPIRAAVSVILEKLFRLFGEDLCRARTLRVSDLLLYARRPC
jgi:hypothetical protein